MVIFNTADSRNYSLEIIELQISQRRGIPPDLEAIIDINNTPTARLFSEYTAELREKEGITIAKCSDSRMNGPTVTDEPFPEARTAGVNSIITDKRDRLLVGVAHTNCGAEHAAEDARLHPEKYVEFPIITMNINPNTKENAKQILKTARDSYGNPISKGFAVVYYVSNGHVSLTNGEDPIIMYGNLYEQVERIRQGNIRALQRYKAVDRRGTNLAEAQNPAVIAYELSEWALWHTLGYEHPLSQSGEVYAVKPATFSLNIETYKPSPIVHESLVYGALNVFKSWKGTGMMVMTYDSVVESHEGAIKGAIARQIKALAENPLIAKMITHPDIQMPVYAIGFSGDGTISEIYCVELNQKPF